MRGILNLKLEHARLEVVKGDMPSVELCSEALRLRLITEDEKCYLQVSEIDEEVNHRAKTDPYNLLSVLSGLRYHVSAGNSLCTLHRENGDVVVEYQTGNHAPTTCRISVDQFRRFIDQVLPSRSRGYMA
ncbi:hypothetical protein [Fimbriimonas ginsengisoli]|uniref:Uncharacterized protein n=1 Tax=Fimbriimonas ginsengisoli Gsoil 348 TaxID=661478 RepID=A0A068NNZ8_FIMGI|nr:hypothetical protein [Fimbriimonas ginsengisoli]AIE85161.1 hypothetical protein OP10G_1793 [Fimbriimonas ginsengisoli Gsoil 348]